LVLVVVGLSFKVDFNTKINVSAGLGLRLVVGWAMPSQVNITCSDMGIAHPGILR
jgi:hypothetical protein